MNIIPIGSSDYIRDSDVLKFVLTKAEDQDLLVIATPFSGEHFQLLPRDAVLIGGGDIKRRKSSTEIAWGSQSCRRELGYDRPQDPDQAEKLIGEMRTAIEEWLNLK